jgi:hypothetical protein
MEIKTCAGDTCITAQFRIINLTSDEMEEKNENILMCLKYNFTYSYAFAHKPPKKDFHSDVIFWTNQDLTLILI